MKHFKGDMMVSLVEEFNCAKTNPLDFDTASNDPAVESPASNDPMGRTGKN